LGAEAPFAGLACKPLDTEWRLLSLEVANLLDRPVLTRIVVVYAVRVRAEGRSPYLGCFFDRYHVQLVARNEPDTISKAQPIQ